MTTVFISLGEDCLPKYLLVTLGFQKRKIEGQKTHPFDLMVSGVYDVLSILRLNFDNFLNSSLYTDCNNMIKHTLYKTLEFNHESYIVMQNSSFYENDYDLLKQRYVDRINNLHHDIEYNHRIIFVIHDN